MVQNDYSIQFFFSKERDYPSFNLSPSCVQVTLTVKQPALRMTSALSITQNFRELTLTLLADLVMVDIDIKILKRQYTYSLNNNYTDLSFTPWSEDLEPSESFQKKF